MLSENNCDFFRMLSDLAYQEINELTDEYEPMSSEDIAEDFINHIESLVCNNGSNFRDSMYFDQVCSFIEQVADENGM